MASQVSSANIAIRTDNAFERPDIQLMTAPIRLDARPWIPGLGLAQQHVFWAGVVLLHLDSRGRVRLRSPNAEDLPSVLLDMLTAQSDIVTLTRGIAAARRIYQSGLQGALTGDERVPGIAANDEASIHAFIRDTAQASQHPVGTCAMGNGPSAVVDPELQVLGVEGLRVVDASVMPTVPGANTNASTIMIAEKASDLILRDGS